MLAVVAGKCWVVGLGGFERVGSFEGWTRDQLAKAGIVVVTMATASASYTATPYVVYGCRMPVVFFVSIRHVFGRLGDATCVFAGHNRPWRRRGKASACQICRFTIAQAIAQWAAATASSGPIDSHRASCIASPRPGQYLILVLMSSGCTLVMLVFACAMVLGRAPAMSVAIFGMFPVSAFLV